MTKVSEHLRIAYPVEADPYGLTISDAEGHKILDIRGWGRLTGKGYGGLGLSAEEAENIQKKRAKHIVDLMNRANTEDLR